MFSVNTKEEAEQLLNLTTSRGMNGEFVVRELAAEQSLERLWGFSLKLKIVYEEIILKRAKKP